MQVRLEQRLQALKRDRQISPMPPVVIGGLLVVPKGARRFGCGATGCVTCAIT